MHHFVRQVWIHVHHVVACHSEFLTMEFPRPRDLEDPLQEDEPHATCNNSKVFRSTCSSFAKNCLADAAVTRRGIDLKKIATGMNGASGAESKAVCTEADIS